MLIQTLLKYSSVISIPLIGLIGLNLAYRLKAFDKGKMLLSESILLMTEKRDKLQLASTFTTYMILNLIFAYYLITRFALDPLSLISISFVISPVFFFMGAIFTEANYPMVHKFFVFTSGIFWFYNAIYLSLLIGNSFLTIYALSTAIIVLGVTFYLLAINKANLYLQVGFLFLMWVWTLWFTILI